MRLMFSLIKWFVFGKPSVKKLQTTYQSLRPLPRFLFRANIPMLDIAHRDLIVTKQYSRNKYQHMQVAVALTRSLLEGLSSVGVEIPVQVSPLERTLINANRASVKVLRELVDKDKEST